MNQNSIQIGFHPLRYETKTVKNEIVKIDNEEFNCIRNFDLMNPFLMSIVSGSDLWMFISSYGSLTAGRINPDHALFPYYTEDKIHDSRDVTGSKTILIVRKDSNNFLWEPLSGKYESIYNSERNLYKNISGNKIIFEEINHDLKLAFRYQWTSCDKYGFVKKSFIENLDDERISVRILDGIMNIMPSGSNRRFQLEYSSLLDAYKKNELLEEINLGIFALSSVPTDRAEPNESLETSVAWSCGLHETDILLSTDQLNNFRSDSFVSKELNSNGKRGSYFIHTECDLNAGEQKYWYIVADVDYDHSKLAELISTLKSGVDLMSSIEKEIDADTSKLKLLIAKADGFQLTSDRLTNYRHLSNVMFNIMRGGVFENNYKIDKGDFIKYLRAISVRLFDQYITRLENLPDNLTKDSLVKFASETGDKELLRIAIEYMPLSFSRRHGDPSRPWNLFSIDIKDEKGGKVYNYQGNWRDIFQNWEALSYSFPEYIESMIFKFLNASTADGYNPYRLTKESFDWEELDPEDEWSYIGYWGDHQIIYLLKLLETLNKFKPTRLPDLLDRDLFVFANVPYRIKPYDEILKDPRNSIEFDYQLNESIKQKVSTLGEAGKYLLDNDDVPYRATLTEKLLIPLMTKISNFVPEAGIWMNTQRPEWNDANNALAGYGASMVTLYYMRRYVSFMIDLIENYEKDSVTLSGELYELIEAIEKIFVKSKNTLSNNLNDEKRKEIVDGLGNAGSVYRSAIYKNNFGSKKIIYNKERLLDLFHLMLNVIDHSIKNNRREDGLYHSYNLLEIADNAIAIHRLDEMLEGQVAVLSSGYLSNGETLELLDNLRNSRLYRADQKSYMLYPEKTLPPFIEKNQIPAGEIEKSQLLKSMLANRDYRLVVPDKNGSYHFNKHLRNSAWLKNELVKLKNDYGDLTEREENLIADIYEKVFQHRYFTGRSGTFYKYEGIGSIYWHMVSKLLLAVEENYYQIIYSGKDLNLLDKLKERYYEIKDGLGIHKSPDEYGAFTTDPYSHTPLNSGVQQPGLTGQVKEDVISRYGELGIVIKDGQISFVPHLLNDHEFLNKSQIFNYYDVNEKEQTMIINAGMLIFTYCQAPIVYSLSDESKIIVNLNDGEREVEEGLVLSKKWSGSIFRREGKISSIIVLINNINKQ
ncbi:hypothetical protein ACSSWA_03445 [Melioribacter sp. Ez-97]|uniref:hypothetical protein n=1 Tax=Melioribacter sp. Ez-97 TaxID=3423434 RepID=UPI003ED8AB87